MTKPTERLAQSAAPERPYGWQEVLAMRASHGIKIRKPDPGCSLSALVVHRLVGQRGTALSLPDLFYELRAEYLHLTRDQRTAKLPGLVLEALNDPHGGIEIVPLPPEARARVA